ncbi:MAG TPA: permease [Burkholderiales bacterium]|nr:permease [Burkholderiales bacterium]
MIVEVLEAGVLALWDYVALHVLTCLIPAFLLAGAMVTFVSKEAIIHYLGAATSKLRSFPTAAGGSFFVAACSCTVIPVGSGLYYGGAAIGAAFILLWVAPAANILALTYTGTILGTEMLVVRVFTALLMAFIVGWVMSFVFRREEAQRLATMQAAAPAGGAPRLVGRSDLILLGLLIVSLLAPNYLIQQGPYWHKVAVWLVASVAVFGYALRVKSRDELKDWLNESWWFVRTIFPYLLIGVFAVGVITRLLPQGWVQEWLGGSTLSASFLATLLGSVTYFATMTEAPFVDSLMKMGMGQGPALTLLLTGPGLSLPNWLAIARIFGAKKAVVYVLTIIVLGTLAGWFAGNFVFSA